MVYKPKNSTGPGQQGSSSSSSTAPQVLHLTGPAHKQGRIWTNVVPNAVSSPNTTTNTSLFANSVAKAGISHGPISRNFLLSGNQPTDSEGTILSVTNGKKRQRDSVAISFTTVCFNGDGQLLATGDKTGTVRIYYLHMNRFTTLQKESNAAPGCLCFTRRKLEELMVAFGNVIRVYSVDSRQPTAVLKSGHTHPVKKMDASGLGGFVLSASSDVCILWDLANWTKIRSLFAQQAPLLDARFSPACTGIQGGMTRGLMRQDGTGRVAKGQTTEICTIFQDSRIVFWNTCTFEIAQELNPDLVALENAATAEGDGYNQRGGLKNKSKLPKNLRLCDLDEKYVVAAGPTHMIVYNRPEQRMVHCVRVTSPVLQVQLGTVRNVMSDGHSSRGNVSRMSLKGELIEDDVEGNEFMVASANARFPESVGEGNPRRQSTSTAIFMLTDDGKFQIVRAGTLEIMLVVMNDAPRANTNVPFFHFSVDPHSHLTALLKSDGSMDLRDLNHCLARERKERKTRSRFLQSGQMRTSVGMAKSEFLAITDNGQSFVSPEDDDIDNRNSRRNDRNEFRPLNQMSQPRQNQDYTPDDRFTPADYEEEQFTPEDEDENGDENEVPLDYNLNGKVPGYNNANNDHLPMEKHQTFHKHPKSSLVNMIQHEMNEILKTQESVNTMNRQSVRHTNYARTNFEGVHTYQAASSAADSSAIDSVVNYAKSALDDSKKNFVPSRSPVTSTSPKRNGSVEDKTMNKDLNTTPVEAFVFGDGFSLRTKIGGRGGDSNDSSQTEEICNEQDDVDETHATAEVLFEPATSSRSASVPGSRKTNKPSFKPVQIKTANRDLSGFDSSGDESEGEEWGNHNVVDNTMDNTYLDPMGEMPSMASGVNASALNSSGIVAVSVRKRSHDGGNHDFRPADRASGTSMANKKKTSKSTTSTAKRSSTTKKAKSDAILRNVLSVKANASKNANAVKTPEYSPPRGGIPKTREGMFNTGKKVTQNNAMPQGPTANGSKSNKNPILNNRTLKQLLLKNGSFPKTERAYVWAFLLQLPNNQVAFEGLCSTDIPSSTDNNLSMAISSPNTATVCQNSSTMQIMPYNANSPQENQMQVFENSKIPCLKRPIARPYSHPFPNLEKRFPNHPQRIYVRMYKILKALTNWCPLLAHCKFLPQLIFPYLKIFGEKMGNCACFEACVVLVLNWCRRWFGRWPHCSRFLSEGLESFIALMEPELYECLVEGVNSANSSGEEQSGKKSLVVEALLYPTLLQSLFTDVLSSENWLQLWDHLIIHWNKPYLLDAAVVAFLRYFKGSLMKMRGVSSGAGPNSSFGTVSGRQKQNSNNMSGYFAAGTNTSQSHIHNRSSIGHMNRSSAGNQQQNNNRAAAFHTQLQNFFKTQQNINMKEFIASVYYIHTDLENYYAKYGVWIKRTMPSLTVYNNILGSAVDDEFKPAEIRESAAKFSLDADGIEFNPPDELVLQNQSSGAGYGAAKNEVSMFYVGGNQNRSLLSGGGHNASRSMISHREIGDNRNPVLKFAHYINEKFLNVDVGDLHFSEEDLEDFEVEKQDFMICPYLPLESNCTSYPIFQEYPQFIVEHEDLRKKEEDEQERKFLNTEQKLLALENSTKALIDRERNYRLEQEALAKEEEERARMQKEQDQRILKQRKEMDERSFQRRLHAIEAVQSVVEMNLGKERHLKEAEMRHQLGDMQRKEDQRRYEYESRLAEEKVFNLELQTQAKVFETMQTRRYNEFARGLKQKVTNEDAKNNLSQELQTRVWQLEDDAQAEKYQHEGRLEMLERTIAAGKLTPVAENSMHQESLPVNMPPIFSKVEERRHLNQQEGPPNIHIETASPTYEEAQIPTFDNGPTYPDQLRKSHITDAEEYALTGADEWASQPVPPTVNTAHTFQKLRGPGSASPVEPFMLYGKLVDIAAKMPNYSNNNDIINDNFPEVSPTSTTTSSMNKQRNLIASKSEQRPLKRTPSIQKLEEQRAIREKELERLIAAREDELESMRTEIYERERS